jgi:hypothetical protein
MFVPPDADAETMEKLRAQLEAGLNEATRKAYAQVGRSEAGRSEVGRPEISVSEKAGHG